MAERTTYRDLHEGQQARSWHSRFDDPFAQQTPVEKATSANAISNPDIQKDMVNAQRIDEARYGDPAAFLEAQLNMMSPDVRAQMQAVLPSNHDFYSTDIIKSNT